MRAFVLSIDVALLAAGAMAQDDDAPQRPKVWVYGPANTKPPLMAPGGKVYHEITSGKSGPMAGDRAHEYVELAGFGREFEAERPALAEADKKELLLEYPAMNREFLMEYAKRMNDAMNVGEYEDVWAKVYEEHFTQDELAAMVQGKRNQMASIPSGVPSQLRQKLLAQGPEMSGEAHAEYRRILVQHSREVSHELFREHPEWAKSVAAAR